MPTPSPEYPISYHQVAATESPAEVARDYDLVGWPESFTLEWARDLDPKLVPAVAYSLYAAIVLAFWIASGSLGPDWLPAGFVTGVVAAYLSSGSIRRLARRHLGTEHVDSQLVVNHELLRLGKMVDGGEPTYVTIRRDEKMRVTYLASFDSERTPQLVLGVRSEVMRIDPAGAVVHGLAASRANPMDVAIAWLPEAVVAQPDNQGAIWLYEQERPYWRPDNAPSTKHGRVVEAQRQVERLTLGLVLAAGLAMTLTWGRAGLGAFNLALVLYFWVGGSVVFVIRWIRSSWDGGSGATPMSKRRKPWSDVGATYRPPGP